MYIYCPKCEAANPENLVLCSLCGHQLQSPSFLKKHSTPKQEVAAPAETAAELDSDVIIAVTGTNGQLEMTDSVVRIKRKGGLALLTHGFKGDKEILISHISSIQFKKAGGMSGYIQIAFVGGQEAKGGIFEATADENTVMFRAGQQKSFEEFRDRLQERMRSISKPSSSLDELEKLALLREKGIVTNEEFQKKKKQILGL